MLLRQIEYFCAVCRTGSFTKASVACCVSQSAISQQVMALEAYLEASLLERRGRSFTLTPAGRNFYEKSQRILAELDDLRFETQGIANGWQSSLVVGYLNRYVGWEIEGAVAAFAARHPGIKIEAVPGSHDDLYQGMLSGHIDIAFNDRRRELSDEFENRFLFTGLDCVEVSGINPLADRSEVSVGDLSDQTCILIAPPAREEAERTYYQDVLGYRCRFRFARTHEEGRMLVAGNHGFLPLESRIEADSSGSIMQRIALIGANNKRRTHDYYAFWLKSHTTPLIEEFSEILEDLFTQK